MNEYVERILRQHLWTILERCRIAVPDDEEEMNWRLFFAHSQGMLGFRADIFTGGPNEPDSPVNPSFRGLRDRWQGDSRQMIAGLAALWNEPTSRDVLIRISNPRRPVAERAKGIQPALELLQRHSEDAAARLFAETLLAFSGPRIARKTNVMIRAYVQNSHLLERFQCSYRVYLDAQAPIEQLFRGNVVSAEQQWRSAIVRDFYAVGSALAGYLIADWLLGFWLDGRIDWFESYKLDSVHQMAVGKGLLPPAAASDFVAYCRTISIPSGFGGVSGKPCPPRVLNECIWLEENGSSSGDGPA
jgi:hypothetical protein